MQAQSKMPMSITYFEGTDLDADFVAALGAFEMPATRPLEEAGPHGEPPPPAEGEVVTGDEWSSSLANAMLLEAANATQAVRESWGGHVDVVTCHKNPPPPPPLPQPPLARSLSHEMFEASAAPKDGSRLVRSRTVLAASTPEPAADRPARGTPSDETGWSPRVPDSLTRWSLSYPPSSTALQLSTRSPLSTFQMSNQSHIVSLHAPRDVTPTQADPLPDTQPRAEFQLPR